MRHQGCRAQPRRIKQKKERESHLAAGLLYIRGHMAQNPIPIPVAPTLRRLKGFRDIGFGVLRVRARGFGFRALRVLLRTEPVPCKRSSSVGK